MNKYIRCGLCIALSTVCLTTSVSATEMQQPTDIEDSIENTADSEIPEEANSDNEEKPAAPSAKPSTKPSVKPTATPKPSPSLKPSPSPSKAPKMSKISFAISDNTNGKFTSQIKVTLINKNDNTKKYQYILTRSQYDKGQQIVGGEVEQGLYEIRVEYDESNLFTLQNVDKTAINSLAISGDSHSFKWEAVSAKADTVVEDDNYVNTNKEVNTSDSNTNSTDSSSDNKQVDESVEEGKRLWENFIKQVTVIKYGQSYKAVLDILGGDTKSRQFETYAKISQADYSNMSSYEKFLWYSTYVGPLELVRSGDYNTYYSSIDAWNKYTIVSFKNVLKDFGTAEMGQAYQELMEWNYYYYKKNNTLYRFMDEMPIEIAPEETIMPENNEDIDEGSQDTTKESEGIWDGVVESVKKDYFTIILLIIALIATGVFMVYKKMKNIDDE